MTSFVWTRHRIARFSVDTFLVYSLIRATSRNLSQASPSLSSLFITKSSGSSKTRFIDKVKKFSEPSASNQTRLIDRVKKVPEPSASNQTRLIDRVKKVPDSRPWSDVDTIWGKIRVGSSHDEIFLSLKDDTVCNSLQLSPELVDLLLQRLKNDWKSAFGFFKWVESCENYKHTQVAYDTMVDILGRTKQLDHMRAFLEEMNRNHMVKLNTVAKVLRRLSWAGEWEEAVKLFDELETYGLEKNTESMNLLLDTLCKEGKVEKARGVFQNLKSRFPPDASTFNIFIHGWSRVGQVDDALRTIQEMKRNKFHPCVISYNPVVQFYCLQNNFTKAYELLSEMETQGPPANVVTYTTIMSSLAISGQYEEALQIAQRMKSAGCKPDTLYYNCLIHALGKTRRLKEAVQVFEKEMPSNGVTPNTSTYNSMIAMYCRWSQEVKALKLLRKMETSMYCKPDIQSYYPLLKSCLQGGKVDNLLSQLLDEMVQKHHLSLDKSTYELLIQRLCKANKAEWAYRLFEEMVGKDIKPIYRTCHLLLDQVKERNMHPAAEHIENILRRLIP